MIADLKPYPEYKESGLPWLGQVPRHWSTRVLKRLCSRSALYGANIPASDYVSAGVRFLRTTDITDEGTLRRGGVFVAEAAAHDYMLTDGDLLVSRSGTIGRSLRYRAEVHGPCAYAGYLVRFVPAPIASADYLFHFTKSLAFADFIRVSAVSSTIENVNGEKYANMPVTLPPPDEQAAIVRFLDWANARLERAIRAKRKVIALLNEQKQAIIHRAVTRGLDPSVPLKPSGIPWLGEIPQHWEVRRLKSVASRIVDCLHATPRYSDSGNYPTIRTADISPGVVHVARAKRISSTDYVRWTARLEPGEGDILYSREGERFGIAACVPPGVRLCISQRMLVFRIGEDDCADFVMRLLNSQSTYGQALQDVMGATAPHVNISTIRNYFLALPKKQEQEAIVLHIKSETSPIDIAISRLEREIELLREYRTRLVADVVTGKLDVREAAARLPDEVEEPIFVAAGDELSGEMEGLAEADEASD